MVLEVIRREGVGHVEREVADAPRVGEVIQVVVIADQVSVGVARANLVQNPLLARLEYARRGDKNSGAEF